jgi:hypothetical protein
METAEGLPTQTSQPSQTGFKGRPYTKVTPFTKTFTGAFNELLAIWQPVGAYFELGLLLAKSTVAGEFAVVDTNAANIIGFIQFDGVNFSRLDLGMAGIRSNLLNYATLALVDVAGVGGTIHGVVYGWEVTQEGNYR